MSDSAGRTLVSDDTSNTSGRLGDALRRRGWSCATAESCTGGGIAFAITSIAGSSDYMQGGIIAYSNAVKHALLGVQQTTLDQRGAVSDRCALEMARGVRSALQTDVGISSTGIAGPGGATARKPVGLVYIAVSTPGGEAVRELRLNGDRQQIMRESAQLALSLANSMFDDGADAPETEY